MVQGTFNSLLPQSTFKVWGVQPNTFKILNIFEYPKREERVIQSAHSMQKVNELIAEFYSFKEVNFIKYDQEVEITNGTFDQQIINLKHHYPNLTIKGQVNLVDYSSLTFTILGVRDIRFGKEFLRAIKRSYDLSKKCKITKFYTLTYPWQEKLTNPTNFFWKAQQLDYESIRKISKLFIQKNIHLFPEVQILNEVKQPVIICPPFDQTYSEFQTWVESNSSKLAIYSKNPLFIKHHRMHIDRFPNNFGIEDFDFITMNSALTSALPLETLVLADNRILVITGPSSVMAIMENILLTKNNLGFHDFFKTKDCRDYGLLIKRMLETKNIKYFN